MTERTVLFVEDESVLRKLARRVLDVDGTTLVSCASGSEALAWLDGAGRPDVVVVDLSMPGMMGDELIRRMREAGVDAPVIGTSGEDPLSAHARFIRAGATEFLPKPYRAHDLLARVSALAATLG